MRELSLSLRTALWSHAWVKSLFDSSASLARSERNWLIRYSTSPSAFRFPTLNIALLLTKIENIGVFYSLVLGELNRQIAELNDANKQLVAANTEKDEQIEALRTRLLDATSAATTQNAAHLAEIAKLTISLADTQTQNEHLTVELSDLGSRMDSLDERDLKVDIQVEGLRSRIAELDSSLSDTKSALFSATDQLRDATARAEGLLAKNERLEMLVSESTSARAALEAENAKLGAQLVACQAECANLIREAVALRCEVGIWRAHYLRQLPKDQRPFLLVRSLRNVSCGPLIYLPFFLSLNEISPVVE